MSQPLTTEQVWQELEKNVLTKNMPPVPDLDAAVVDYCRMTVPADSYQVAFHNRPVQTTKLGGYKFGYRAPDFSGQGLALTTLAGKLLAEAIAGTAERFDVFARLPHRAFPGGRALRTPLLVLAMTYYRLRDLL